MTEPTSSGPGWASDEFLGHHLQRTVVRLQTPDALQSALEHLRAHSKWMIEARAPAESVRLLTTLTARGFSVVDTNTQLDCPAAVLRKLPLQGAGWSIRRALPTDRADVCRIAAEQLTLSRFHLDPHIERAQAGEVKHAWVGNFFESKRGDGLFIVDAEGSVAGFLLVLERAPVGIIDLIAVEPRVRGTGAVGGLIAAWLDQSRHLERVVVGTQLANTRSLRAYGKLGFRVCTATHVLHRHSDAEHIGMEQDKP